MESYYSVTYNQKLYLACWKITDGAEEFKPGCYQANILHGDRSSTVVIRRPQKKIQVDWFTYVLGFGYVMIAAQSPEYCWVTFADRGYAAAFYNMWESCDASALLMTVTLCARETLT